MDWCYLLVTLVVIGFFLVRFCRCWSGEGYEPSLAGSKLPSRGTPLTLSSVTPSGCVAPGEPAPFQCPTGVINWGCQVDQARCCSGRGIWLKTEKTGLCLASDPSQDQQLGEQYILNHLS